MWPPQCLHDAKPMPICFMESNRHCNSCGQRGYVGYVKDRWQGCANPKCVGASALGVQEHCECMRQLMPHEAGTVISVHVTCMRHTHSLIEHLSAHAASCFCFGQRGGGFNCFSKDLHQPKGKGPQKGRGKQKNKGDKKRKPNHGVKARRWQ